MVDKSVSLFLNLYEIFSKFLKQTNKQKFYSIPKNSMVLHILHWEQNHRLIVRDSYYKLWWLFLTMIFKRIKNNLKINCLLKLKLKLNCCYYIHVLLLKKSCSNIHAVSLNQKVFPIKPLIITQKKADWVQSNKNVPFVYTE